MSNSILDINTILSEYSTDIQDALQEEAMAISKKGANELKNASGTYTVRTGKYNRGWKVKTIKGHGFISCTIHNSTNYQLTHLLENGHRLVGRTGQHKTIGMTRSFKHIAPVESRCIREYEKNIENIIKNGG